MSQNPHTAFPLVRTLGAVAVLLGLVACAAPRPDASATANLQATRGNTASGTVRFVQTGDKVQVTGEVKGLKPNAEHGFHVHEKGDCSSGDGMSTGGHFNPTTTAHGQHGQGAHHVGDLPSLMADAQGVAKIDFTSTTLTLKPGTTSIMDKGLIVHRDPDDYKTQPTGNSGPRVACGVIRAS
ncbi:superoxide dismutase family protein [Candidatus Skiveiella danica]|jgi:Cu-Zn family superoxide dismutase|uniref:superoxide dismutase family protein n=1 Tax=Candidatus Skiveiella danica TaxID=3386177 RepID=UPI00390B9A14|nr:superoxide dismutase family protein [Comamonadaceae bacterium]MBK6558987.1 superoxide dismutase family protein [Comamonadaceae bacterium]MBK9987932.1 superoxide dismutase family protein [Betaproteobacteria bacterium]